MKYEIIREFLELGWNVLLRWAARVAGPVSAQPAGGAACGGGGCIVRRRAGVGFCRACVGGCAVGRAQTCMQRAAWVTAATPPPLLPACPPPAVTWTLSPSKTLLNTCTATATWCAGRCAAAALRCGRRRWLAGQGRLWLAGPRRTAVHLPSSPHPSTRAHVPPVVPPPPAPPPPPPPRVPTPPPPAPPPPPPRVPHPPTHRPTHPPTHLQEGMTDGFDEQTAYGEIYGMDDPTMVRWK